VGADVALQQPWSREAFTTDTTFARLAVCSHVHRKGGYRHIDLVAMGTVSGFGVCQRPVRLPMPGQVAGRAVTFPAIRTLTFLVVGRRLLRSLFRSYRVVIVVIIVFLDDIFVGTRTVDYGARVVSEVDDADFGQLRQVVQLVSDRRLLGFDDVFVGVWHFRVRV
jgi:hypothetical protein